jgi:hypothetical protein
MKTISEHIANRLAALNASHPGIKNVAASNEAGIQKVRDAMERTNKNLDKMSFEGVELSKDEIAQIKLKVPDAFKNKPVMYEAVANHYFGDGSLAGKTKFSIEVIN